MVKGDIILVPFPFTDLSGNKLRPAIVLFSTNYDVTISFITTQTKWKETTDIDLMPSKRNGIKQYSIVRLSKIATVDKSLVVGKLGDLTKNEIEELNDKLKQLLQLL